MGTRPEFLTLEGASGQLGALRWPGDEGAPTLLAVHGITANAWHFDPLAHHLHGAAHVVAVDLRGRGRSADHSGPFGIDSHADDIAALAGQFDAPVAVVGHSMGAYVALRADERHPSTFSHLVAVDGGTPLPEPDPDADIAEVLHATLGPAIERLRTTWPDRVSYQTMWTQHPAFGVDISLDLQRNLLADLAEVPGGFRVMVNEDAVLTDGRDLLVDGDVRTVLERRSEPTTVVRAPSGLDGRPPPLINDEMVDRLSQHRWVTVPDTNHYTVLLGPNGAMAVADAVRSELGV